MGKVSEGTKPSEETCVFYLPHSSVERPDAETTKLRVVFDASAKNLAGESLNNVVYPGPKTQKDRFGILLSICLHCVILKADLLKMFNQTELDPG